MTDDFLLEFPLEGFSLEDKVLAVLAVLEVLPATQGGAFSVENIATYLNAEVCSVQQVLDNNRDQVRCAKLGNKTFYTATDALKATHGDMEAPLGDWAIRLIAKSKWNTFFGRL
jgi:hypothetical protein